MAEKIKYTREGYAALEEEYKERTGKKREEIRIAIDTARSFGDLSENSEYDEARNEQAKNEARIEELKAMMENAEIIDEEAIDAAVVGLGSTVKIYNGRSGAEQTYSIVGSNEANPMEGRVSDLSPIGRAMIGRRVGDTVSVSAPAGAYEIRILEVTRTQK